jgi:hypothetical protein
MYEFIARISCPASFKIPQRDGQSLLADRIRRRDSREGSVKQFCSVLLLQKLIRLVLLLKITIESTWMNRNQRYGKVIRTITIISQFLRGMNACLCFLCYESPVEVEWLEWWNAMGKWSSVSEVTLIKDLIHDQWRSYDFLATGANNCNSHPK